MQTIEVKINQIKYTSGIELKSKIRDGERTYILDGHTVEKIFKQHIEQITMLRSMLIEKNKPQKVNNELHRTVGQPDKTSGAGSD